MTHLPTGIVVAMQDQRSQQQKPYEGDGNLEDTCLRLLRITE